MYGVTRPQQVIELARDVCDVLGHGKGDAAVSLLIETAAQETHLGALRDRHNHKLGVGLCQFDEIGFVDVRNRTPERHATSIMRDFGIDVRAIEHRELAHSPLLSLVFCRLKYKLIAEAIPQTVEGRGGYWKKYYNSELGAGTAEEYIETAHRFVKPLLTEAL